MNNIIEVNGIKHQAITTDNTSKQIIVADRGWVFVGDCTTQENGDVLITDASVIRRWGTDEQRPGLGWLAQHGVTEKTVLDPSGTVLVPQHSVIAVFGCNEAAWK